jgi:integrase
VLYFEAAVKDQLWREKVWKTIMDARHQYMLVIPGWNDKHTIWPHRKSYSSWQRICRICLINHKGEIMGSLFQRGKYWYIQYYENGKQHQESSKSTSKMVANRLLKKREGDILDGKIPSVRYEKTQFRDLKKLILDDYKLNKRKSLDRVKYSLQHLEPYFKRYRAAQISSDSVVSYTVFRSDEGAANATINRELSCLKRMLNLGLKYGKIGAIPQITMLAEKNVRKGFFEHEDYLAVREHLPEYLKGYITFAFKTGWRRAEIIGLTWAQVDRKN